MVRALAIVVVVAIAHVAVAQPNARDQAADHFKRAEALDKQGRYQDAIAEYEQAFALVPNVDVLFNIAASYERLGKWAKAADYYERYLTERTDTAADADAVITKINELRAKARATQQPLPPPPNDQQPPPPPFEQQPPQQQPPVTTTTTVTAPPPTQGRWHLAASYGIAVGEAPNERYLLRGGAALLSRRLETDAIIGAFGKNDYALGVLARVTILRFQPWSLFAQGAATIGIAKQDNSSTAQMRFPFGFEVGGGMRYGTRYRVELAVVARFVRGGWTSDATTAESYVNDEAAVAVDLGFAFDLPSGGGR